MGQLRPVSKVEKLIFPILVTIVISLMVPSAAPLVGMLMFGNLLKESGVCDRLVKTSSERAYEHHHYLPWRNSWCNNTGR